MRKRNDTKNKTEQLLQNKVKEVVDNDLVSEDVELGAKVVMSIYDKQKEIYKLVEELQKEKSDREKEGNYFKDLLQETFQVGVKAIYDKLGMVGHSLIYYTREEDFHTNETLYVNNLKSFKRTLDKICESALNDFMKLDYQGKKGKLFSISINLKVQTLKKDVNTSKIIEWCEGYTMGAAFRSTKEAEIKGIKCNDECNNVDNYEAVSAKTKFFENSQNREMTDVNDEKAKNRLPNGGISFSERFIGDFTYDNLVSTNTQTNKTFEIAGKTYKVQNKNFAWGTFDGDKRTKGEDYKYFVDNFEDLAKCFDDGSNKNENKQLRIYPDPAKPTQKRNQALFIPIFCKKGTDNRRIGYIQLTAYYTGNDKEKSWIQKGKDNLNKEVCDLLFFYRDWVLLADKIFNLQNSVIEQDDGKCFIGISPERKLYNE